MKNAAVALIKFYQKYVSPIKGRTCRFYPTCSQYAVDAFQKYGVVKGSCLTIRRLIKCQPFNPGGYDPLK